jgi:hypothetical protein
VLYITFQHCRKGIYPETKRRGISGDEFGFLYFFTLGKRLVTNALETRFSQLGPFQCGVDRPLGPFARITCFLLPLSCFYLIQYSLFMRNMQYYHFILFITIIYCNILYVCSLQSNQPYFIQIQNKRRKSFGKLLLLL